MKRSSRGEIFWKILVWRIIFSMPLSVIINYCYYHSFSTVLSITIVSNIVGYIVQYIFESSWPKMWKIANHPKIKFLKDKRGDKNE